MSENLQLKKIATEYAEGEIEESEFLRRIMEEIAYQHSTTFWCKVLEMKDKHDYATRRLKE